MTDNVVPFTPRPNRSAREAIDAERERAAERARQAAEAIRSEIGKRPRLDDKRDRIQVGRNMELLLDRLDHIPGWSRRRLCRELGRGDSETASTKWLYAYTVPANLSVDMAEKRAAKLARKAKSFLQVTDKLTDALNLTSDEVVSELFRDTSYSQPDIGDDPATLAFETVRDLMVRSAASIINTHVNELRDYEKALSSGVIGWDVEKGFGPFYSFPFLGVLPRIEDKSSCGATEAGFCPAVKLYGRKLDGVTARVTGHRYDADQLLQRLPPGKLLTTSVEAEFDQILAATPMVEAVNLPVSLEKEVWWVLAPCGLYQRQWKPMFEIRLRLVVRKLISTYHVNDFIRNFFSDCSLFNLAEQAVPDRLKSFPRRSDSIRLASTEEMITHLRNGIPIYSFDDPEDSVQKAMEKVIEGAGEHDLFHYRSINLSSCKDLLEGGSDLAPAGRDEYDLNFDWSDKELGEYYFPDWELLEGPRAYTSSPRGSIAHAIEENFLHHAVEDFAIRGLDSMLLGDFSRKKAALDEILSGYAADHRAVIDVRLQAFQMLANLAKEKGLGASLGKTS